MRTLPTGYTIADRYQLAGVLGSGGMGTVYRARDLRLQRKVAVKLLHHIRSPRDSERFRREMVAMAACESPHLVPIFDAGQDGQHLFLVMKLLHGRTLRELLKKEAPLSPQRAVSHAEQLLQALDTLHGKGLIHRDIKPSNVMVDDEDWLTLLDMGIVLDPSADALTTRNMVLGTPKFMSPEQRTGRKLDVRSDLYSVGLVLLESLSGGLPRLDVDDSMQIPYFHHLIRVAPELGRVAARIIAQDRADRFDSATATRAALLSALHRTPRAVAEQPHDARAAEQTTGDSSDAAATSVLQTGATARRHPMDRLRLVRWKFAILAGSLVVFASATVALLWRWLQN